MAGKQKKTHINQLYNLSTKYYYMLNDFATKNDVENYNLYSSQSITLAWDSLVSGHYKASWALYAAFKEGIGAKENDYLAKLMYGVAQKVGYCLSEDENIPEHMYPLVNQLYLLVKKAHNKYAKDGITSQELYTQIEIFRDAIKLPNNETVFNYMLSPQYQEIFGNAPIKKSPTTSSQNLEYLKTIPGFENYDPVKEAERQKEVDKVYRDLYSASKVSSEAAHNILHNIELMGEIASGSNNSSDSEEPEGCGSCCVIS